MNERPDDITLGAYEGGAFRWNGLIDPKVKLFDYYLNADQLAAEYTNLHRFFV